MYRRILVPLDGSSRSESILPYVEELALSFDSSVIFLEVLKPVSVPPLNPDPYVVETIEAREHEQELAATVYLNGRCGEFRERHIAARTKLARGPIVAAIIEAAAYENADLIAMASHGRTGLDQVVQGSVANGVLHSADRPVLLIRAEN